MSVISDSSSSPRTKGLHSVQFYDNDHSLLTASVVGYLLDGLTRGGAVIVIATPEHTGAFTQGLKQNGIAVEEAIRNGRLVFRDARATLARLSAGGYPQWELFVDAIGTLLQETRRKFPDVELRAYGEMVDLLWNCGNSRAANRLEQFWNALIAEHEFSLMCAYQIDVFGREFQPAVLDGVLCAHTHLVPGSSSDDLAGAVNRAIGEVLGARSEGLKRLMKAEFRPSWGVIPNAESAILWVRNNLPEYADEIFARAKEYYRASIIGESAKTVKLPPVLSPA